MKSVAPQRIPQYRDIDADDRTTDRGLKAFKGGVEAHVRAALYDRVELVVRPGQQLRDGLLLRPVRDVGDMLHVCAREADARPHLKAEVLEHPRRRGVADLLPRRRETDPHRAEGVQSRLDRLVLG